MRKHLLWFLALAVLLLAGRLAWRLAVPGHTTALEVTVPQGADDGLREQRVRDEILLEEAISLNLHLRDPVVIGRLAINVLFVRGEPVDPDHLPENARELAEEAIAMNMHRTDPVARRRLVDVMERALLHDFEREDPSDQAIREHLEAYADEFKRAAQYRFDDRYFSIESRGESSARTAATVALQDATTNAGTMPPTVGDAPLFINRGTLTTATALNARYGRSFGDRLAECAIERWCGPIQSSFGFHLVRVVESIPERLPELAEIRPEVVGSWRDEHRRSELIREARKIGRRYDVTVVEEEAEAPR